MPVQADQPARIRCEGNSVTDDPYTLTLEHEGNIIQTEDGRYKRTLTFDIRAAGKRTMGRYVCIAQQGNSKERSAPLDVKVTCEFILLKDQLNI